MTENDLPPVDATRGGGVIPQSADLNSLIVNLLEAMGIAQQDVTARIEALRAKYPDLDALPISEVENIVAQFLNANRFKWLIVTAAGAFLDLVKTGKSEITSDPSALA